MILCGCWDRIEIEKNAFILGIGVDLGSDDTLEVTYQIALPQSMKGGEEGKNSGDSSTTLNVTIQGESLKVTEQILMSHIDRFPNYDHLKAIIFGERLSGQGLAEHIDFFFRNPQARRLTKAVVCEGTAKDILAIQPKTTKSTAQYIDSLLENNNKHTIYMLATIDLTKLEDKFLNNTDFALAKLSIKEDTIDIQGAGIFKTGQLVGWLQPHEVAAVKWISNKMDKGVFDILSLDDQVEITTEIVNSSSKISPAFNGNNFTFNVNIKLEFDIAEVSKLDYIVLDETSIAKVERAMNSEIKELCEKTFYEIRDNYNADVYNFSKKISNYYPLFWEENKEIWNDYFERTDILVEVETKMRRVGLVK